jgi:hypothetical protein
MEAATAPPMRARPSASEGERLGRVERSGRLHVAVAVVAAEVDGHAHRLRGVEGRPHRRGVGVVAAEVEQQQRAPGLRAVAVRCPIADQHLPRGRLDGEAHAHAAGEGRPVDGLDRGRELGRLARGDAHLAQQHREVLRVGEVGALVRAVGRQYQVG